MAFTHSLEGMKTAVGQASLNGAEISPSMGINFGGTAINSFGTAPAQVLGNTMKLGAQ